jgi:hypothetical protein
VTPTTKEVLVTRRLFIRYALVLVLLAALLGPSAVLLGCKSSPPSDPVGIRGTITGKDPGDGRPAAILVEGPKQQPAGSASDKARVTITPQTLFFDKAGNPTDGAALVVGANVDVWFEGAVAESYPVQGSAKAIQLISK